MAWRGTVSRPTRRCSAVRGCASRNHGVNRPRSRNALQFVLATILKLQPAPGDEIGHSPTHEHFAWSSHRRHTLADMHSDAADVVTAQLHLSRVEPRTNLDAERPDALAYGMCASHRARRTVER